MQTEIRREIDIPKQSSPERVDILGVRISALNMDSAVSYLLTNLEAARHQYVCMSNVHTTVYAKEHPKYREIQNRSFLSLPDGKPLSIIGKRRGYADMGRVTGPDFMEEILKRSQNGEYRHYFYGNTADNLERLLSYLKERYPGLTIAGSRPSLFRDASDEELNLIAEEINATRPDFVWVGLGAPRQEIFCDSLSPQIDAVMIGVGGAFNVICGIIPRAPRWMQDLSLEWLFRWSREPTRLFKRYFMTNVKFLVYMITGV